MEAEVSALNTRQANLRDEAQKAKAVFNELGDRIANTKFHILNLKQETEKLKLQIVKSPKKLKQVGEI